VPLGRIWEKVPKILEGDKEIKGIGDLRALLKRRYHIRRARLWRLSALDAWEQVIINLIALMSQCVTSASRKVIWQ
jgi:hypothetical protein